MAKVSNLIYEIMNKFIIYVALATIIALILSKAENLEVELKCGDQGEQPQAYLRVVVNGTIANRNVKSVVDRFAAMQEESLTGAVHDRGKFIYGSLVKFKEIIILW